MKSFFVFLVSLLLLVSTALCDGFYYGTTGPVTLLVDSNLVAVKFDNATPISLRQSIIQQFPRINEQIQTPDTIDGYVLYLLGISAGYSAFIDSLSQTEAIIRVEPAYRAVDSTLLFVGDEFVVRFPEGWSQSIIDSLVTSNGATKLLEMNGMQNVWVMHNTTSSGLTTLEIANLFHEIPGVIYSHPSFGNRPKKLAYTVYDYYRSYQPHINRVVGTINHKSVWDFAGMTRSVTVAVVDDGVAPHEDLPSAKFVQGIDFVGDTIWGTIDFDPVPGPEQAHGQACAGIIGALHSLDPVSGANPSSGVISLSPRAKIQPIKIWGDDGFATGYAREVAEAFVWVAQNGAEVISNSWGWNTPYYDSPVLSDAIERVTLFGRNGKGCPVIFAAGNNAFSNPEYPANLPFVFAVGASKYSNDSLWRFSSYGPELDVVAPSSDGNSEPVWGLDQMGALGYNPATMSDCPPQSNNQNYDCHFGGTSAACPIVAGVASLLLAKDSTLSAQAVYYILRHSADTALAWGSFAPPNNRYGCGVVNAFNAILSISHGDLSNDNHIDLSDLSLLIGYMTLTPRPSIFPSDKLADMNCSGSIDLSDLNWMIALVVSTPGSVPGPVKPCFKF